MTATRSRGDSRRVRLAPGLLLSAQRYRRPAGDVIDIVPSSLGALPLVLDAAQRSVRLPLADEEACWLGLEPAPPWRRLPLTIQDSNRTARVEPAGALAFGGWRRDDGRLQAIVRPTSQQRLVLRLAIGDAPAWALLLLAPSRFEAETGRPGAGPLDETAGYRGWRLP